jgi:FkbM family methyltransferase
MVFQKELAKSTRANYFEMILDKFSGYLFRKKLRGSTFFHKTFLSGKNLVLHTRDETCLSLDPNDYVDRFIIDHGYYESEVLDAILGHLPESGVFWDVGANIGIHAVSIARKMPKTKVFCFEPNPIMAKRIQINAELNQVTLNIQPTALGKEPRKGFLYLHQGNTGMSSTHNWSGQEGVNKIEIQIKKADDLCPGLVDPPNVVKIDVEGGEIDVLEGMDRILGTKELRAVIFEDNLGDSAAKKKLQEKGFRIQQLKRKEPTHHNLENYLTVK